MTPVTGRDETDWVTVESVTSDESEESGINVNSTFRDYVGPSRVVVREIGLLVV